MASRKATVEYLTTAKIGEKGPLTVPKQFCEDLGLATGAPFAVLRLPSLEADELIEHYRHLVKLTDPEMVAVPSRSIVLAQNHQDHFSAEARDQRLRGVALVWTFYYGEQGDAG